MVDIDYGAIVKKSWAITKRQKWLWIYGLVLAVFGGSGGGGGGSNFNLSSGSSKTIKELPKEVPKQMAQVLGETTNLITQWFAHIPPATWITVILVLAAVVLLGIFSAMVIRSWAKAALITALSHANETEVVTLSQSSRSSMQKILPLILFGILAGLLILGIMIGSTTVAGLGYLLFMRTPILKIIWIILAVIAVFLTVICTAAIMAAGTVYGERLIVLENMSPIAALKRGFGLGKNQFIPTLVMGIINSAISCSVGCLSLVGIALILGIPGFILVLPSIMNRQFPPLFNIFGLGTLVILYFYINYLITAILTVFTYSNWNLLFKEVIRQEKNEK